MNRLIVLAVITASLLSCTSRQADMENRLRKFITEYEKKAIPLYRESALADWNANISGSDDDWEKSEKASLSYREIYADTSAFKELREIKESGLIRDSLLSRQLDILFRAYLGSQVDHDLIAGQIRMETELSRKYSNFRAKVNGKELSDNQIEDILRNSTRDSELKAAWEGHKMIGPLVADEITELVKHRNIIAGKLGFKDFHDMRLRLSGLDPDEVDAIFKELDDLTRDTFKKTKEDIDAYLANHYKIKPGELQPWHYQNRFFQEAPEIYSVDFDKYYKDQDPVRLVSSFYDGIGLNVDAILEKSDLYEKPGKNQHAFCTDIDRSGDVRTLNNIRPDSYWMNTILHELGHGVYSFYTSRDLPFTLREEAHSFTTEAIANLFGQLATDPEWMKDMGIITEEECQKISGESRKALSLSKIVFSRWAQVMYWFEKYMYQNPDQDLNQLWWNMVEKYQMIRKPENRDMPDWAAKVHVALYPCYYHNYLLGDLLAAQYHHHIATNITEKRSFTGEKAVGDYLKKMVFSVGAKYDWDEMITRSTGEKLTAKYYADQFVN